MDTTASTLDLQAVEKLREEELEEARSIQSVMLPAEALHAGRVTISHAFQPMAEVGRDFLDYFELTDGSVGLYLGDVSGKGRPAAMYAALAIGTLRGVHKTGQSPGDVLSTLNRRLLIRGPQRRHAAAQYAVFDPQRGEMQVAGAGMPTPFHISSRGCQPVEISGLPPGLFATTVAYETSKLKIEPSDSVLFLTDGVTEAFNTEDEGFGIERLQEICEKGGAAHRPNYWCRYFPRSASLGMTVLGSGGVGEQRSRHRYPLPHRLRQRRCNGIYNYNVEVNAASISLCAH